MGIVGVLGTVGVLGNVLGTALGTVLSTLLENYYHGSQEIPYW